MSNNDGLWHDFDVSVDHLHREIYASRNRNPRDSILVLMPIALRVKTIGRTLGVPASRFPPAVLQFFKEIQVHHDMYLSPDIEQRADIILNTAFLFALPPQPTHHVEGFTSALPTQTSRSSHPPGNALAGPSRSNLLPGDPPSGNPLPGPSTSATRASNPNAYVGKPIVIRSVSTRHSFGGKGMVRGKQKGEEAATGDNMMEEEDMGDVDEDDMEVDDDYNQGADEEDADNHPAGKTAKRDNSHLTSPPGKLKKKTKVAFRVPGTPEGDREDDSIAARRQPRNRRAPAATKNPETAKSTKDRKGGKGKGRMASDDEDEEGSAKLGKGASKAGKGTIGSDDGEEEGAPKPGKGAVRKGKGEMVSEGEDDAAAKSGGRGGLKKGKGKAQPRDRQTEGDGDDGISEDTPPAGYHAAPVPCYACQEKGAKYCWKENPHPPRKKEGACHRCRNKKGACRFPDEEQSAAQPAAIQHPASLANVTDTVVDLQADVYGLLGVFHAQRGKDALQLNAFESDVQELRTVTDATDARVGELENAFEKLRGVVKGLRDTVQTFPDLRHMQTAIGDIEKQLRQSTSSRASIHDETRLNEIVKTALSTALESRMADVKAQLEASLSQDHYGDLATRVGVLEGELRDLPYDAGQVAGRVVSALEAAWPTMMAPIVSTAVATELRARVGEIDGNIARIYGELQQQLTSHIQRELSSNMKTIIQQAVDVTMESMLTLSRVPALGPAPLPLPSIIDPDRIADVFNPEPAPQDAPSPMSTSPVPRSASAVPIPVRDGQLHEAIYGTALTALPDNVSSVRARRADPSS